MEPFNPISSTPVNPPDTDSAASEDNKAQQRRDDRAQAFKQALGKGTVPGAPATPTPQGKKPFTMPTARARTAAADESALNPALMRLRAEGYPLGETTAKAKPTVEEKPEVATTKGDEKREAPRPAESTSSDPVKQASESSSNAGRNRQGGNEKEMTKGKQDASAPDPRLLAGPVLLPNTTQSFQAAVEGAANRPAPPPELLNELVEFAAVHRNADGLMEFRLGLVRQALGGLQIQLQAYGNRRVGLKIKSGGKGGIGEEEVAGLIDALKSRNFDVVDV